MIIGVVSDTHQDKAKALPHVMEEFKRRDVKQIVHCGDIDPKHFNPESFLGLPVVCALIPEQESNPAFSACPAGWEITKPKDRIRDHMYVGHKRSYDFLKGTEIEMAQMLADARRDFDGLRWYFSGHTHHQIFLEIPTVKFVNPGAIEEGFDGFEYAVIDTDTSQVVFSRILCAKPQIDTFSVGVISDSLNISLMDPNFWKLLAKEFHARDVKEIIHCGNISLADIGRDELKDFTVHYNLRPDQRPPKNAPTNWRQIPLESQEAPVVEINGYLFYVQLDLGIDLLGKSEIGMSMLSMEKRRKYPEISYILCGFTNNALYVENKDVRIINPGDANKDRNFAVICLPRAEITFGHVPTETYF
jgi:predicted phosphodiesterase